MVSLPGFSSFHGALKMEKSTHYWQLIKSHQTGLLLLTGIAGYISARCPVLNWDVLLGLTLSLFLAISGSTILNMIYDRDIDEKMGRTCQRPLPSSTSSSRSPARGSTIRWCSMSAS